MELIEVKCVVCGSPIYVYEDYIKDRMYCTLHCLNVSITSEKQQMVWDPFLSFHLFYHCHVFSRNYRVCMDSYNGSWV